MFPQSFIDKIKNTVDMKLLAEEYTELKKVGQGIYRGRCPHPNHIDNKPSFCVWTKFNSWSCLTCHQGKKSDKFKNYGSDCIAFIMWIEKKSWIDSVKYLAKKYSIPLPSRKNEKLFKQKKELAYSYMENLKGESFKYLCNRGLDSEDCYEWGLGLIGPSKIAEIAGTSFRALSTKYV